MATTLFESEKERSLAESLSKLVYCNPFLPERIEFERESLGGDFLPADAVWSKRPDPDKTEPNVARILERAEALARRVRARLAEALNRSTLGTRAQGKAKPPSSPADGEYALYEEVVLFVLFHRYQARFRDLIREWIPHRRSSQRKIPFYREFIQDLEFYLGAQAERGDGAAPLGNEADVSARPSARERQIETPAHLFACFFQIRRAFHTIFENILGDSMPAARLRAAVWQSIFTHDMRRYRRVLYNRMGDFTCLITGPSGTGKELVARAIGLSRYIPFDPKTETLTEEWAGAFYPLNLSALTPTLIESELFGHRRGAFTGALQDRAGWLEVCPALGTVFLDEIGELDPEIQVKLLRVLQSRTFQRIGDTEDRFFRGKLIAATNRDLDAQVRAGRFREDFFYRLCSDRITTPSLHEQIRESPETLHTLVLFLARRMVGEDEAPGVTQEVLSWIEGNLGTDYPWPGNVRELEQCTRNVLIRRSYRPLSAPRTDDPRRALAEDVVSGRLTADELLTRYTNLLYRETGNYQETANRLGVDPRTVKARVKQREDEK